MYVSIANKVENNIFYIKNWSFLKKTYGNFDIHGYLPLIKNFTGALWTPKNVTKLSKRAISWNVDIQNLKIWIKRIKCCKYFFLNYENEIVFCLFSLSIILHFNYEHPVRRTYVRTRPAWSISECRTTLHMMTAT